MQNAYDMDVVTICILTLHLLHLKFDNRGLEVGLYTQTARAPILLEHILFSEMHVHYTSLHDKEIPHFFQRYTTPNFYSYVMNGL